MQEECGRLRRELEALAAARNTSTAELQTQAVHLGREREELSAQLHAEREVAAGRTQAHEEQLRQMQAAVSECLATCDALAAELAAANAARGEATAQAEAAAQHAQQLQVRG